MNTKDKLKDEESKKEITKGLLQQNNFIDNLVF